MKSNKLQSEKGSSLVEYSLLLALVAVIAIPSVQGFSAAVSAKTHLIDVCIASGGGSNSTECPQS